MNKYIPKYIEEFYRSLDSLEIMNSWEQNRLLKTINRRISPKWLNNIIAERKALVFHLEDGELICHSQLLENGSPKRIEFTLDEIEYYKERTESTISNVMRTRYAHIIWQFTHHNKFAKIALYGYLEHFQKLENHDLNYLIEIINAAHQISVKSKIEKEVVKQLIKVCLENFPLLHCNKIITIIIRDKLFNQEELKTLAVGFSERLSNILESEFYLNKICLLNILTFFEKADYDRKCIYRYLAENENKLISSIEDESNFARFDAVIKKAEYYKLAGMKKESAIAYRDYTELKTKVELSRFESRLSPELESFVNQYIITVSKELLKREPDDIFAYFSISEDILIDSDLSNDIKKEKILESVYNLFTLTVFDINSNSKQLTDEEKKKYLNSKLYQAQQSLLCYSLFLRVFIDGIACGKITYYSLYNFLEKETWFNEKFTINLAKRHDYEQMSWLPIISPGIHNFFTQFEYSTLWRTERVNNFILSIDSLTLKFEGILRDFIRLGGGVTTQTKDNLPHELLLEKLIDHEISNQFFSKKEIAFFKYLYTKEGLNLRNDVAHSFMHYGSYDIQKAAMIFLSLLRLGKYNLVEKSNK